VLLSLKTTSPCTTRQGKTNIPPRQPPRSMQDRRCDRLPDWWACGTGHSIKGKSRTGSFKEGTGAKVAPLARSASFSFLQLPSAFNLHTAIAPCRSQFPKALTETCGCGAEAEAHLSALSSNNMCTTYI